jgi:hypothetical protein
MAKSDIFTGGGRLYFEKLKGDGTFDPILYFGKTDGISMTTSVEWKEHYDSEGCTPLLDARFPSKKTAEVKFSTSEITLEMQNRAFLGTIVETDQVAGTDVAIVVAGESVLPGYIVDLGYYNAEGIIVKDETDTTTYVEGVDYEFDSKAGFLTVDESGSIVGGVGLNVTLGTVPAQTIKTSATMKESALLGRFTVVTSSQTGNNFKYIFKKLSVTQDGDFSLKGDEIGTLSFAGSAMVDSNTNNGELSDYIDIIELSSTAC